MLSSTIVPRAQLDSLALKMCIDLGKDRFAQAMLSRCALPRERIGIQMLHMYTSTSSTCSAAETVAESVNRHLEFNRWTCCGVSTDRSQRSQPRALRCGSRKSAARVQMACLGSLPNVRLPIDFRYSKPSY